MIVDCFTYMNERDVLRARLSYLADIVDRFVIVEATSTFQGAPRELDFPKIRDDLPVEAERIVYVAVSNLPVEAGAWECERYVRNSIARGLAGLPPDSLIVISDADEIIRREVLIDLEAGLTEPLALGVSYSAFRVNWEWRAARNRAEPRAIRLEDLESPDELRWRRTSIRTRPNSGWHISWIGDAGFARQKLASFSHSELSDLLAASGHIETCVSLGVDIIGRGVLRRLPDSETFPGFPREAFSEYWAQRRTPSSWALAHLYNFAIPGLRLLGFPNRLGLLRGVLRSLPIRTCAALSPRKAIKRFRRLLLRLFGLLRRA